MAVARNGMPVTTKSGTAEGNATTENAGPRVTVLMVEPDPRAAGLLWNALLEVSVDGLQIEWMAQVSDALELLSAGGIDVVLVAPRLPDDDGVDAFARIRAATADALILPLNDSAPDASGVNPGEFQATRERDARWLADALRYVTRRKTAEDVLLAADEALFEEKERARVTLSSIGDAVLVTDLLGRVSYLNPIAETMTGWTCTEAIGRPLSEVFDIIDGTTRQSATDPAQRAISEDRTVELEANCVLRCRDGSESGIEDSAAPIHDRHNRVSGAVIVFRDISQSRAMTTKMAHMARHDILTDLPNRDLLNERFFQAIELARRHARKVALLFVDLDEFKLINDSLGHLMGDLVLKSVARLLTDCVRAADTVCRQGGDEFLILLSEIEHPDDAEQVARKVQACFTEPLTINGQALHVPLSIGIAVYPIDGETMEDLIQHADRAMYQAKLDGHAAWNPRERLSAHSVSESAPRRS